MLVANAALLALICALRRAVRAEGGDLALAGCERVRGTRAPSVGGSMDSPGHSTRADYHRSSAVSGMVQKRGHLAAYRKSLVEDGASRFSLPGTSSWAARYPVEFWSFVILAVLFIGMGTLRMARQRGLRIHSGGLALAWAAPGSSCHGTRNLSPGVVCLHDASRCRGSGGHRNCDRAVGLPARSRNALGPPSPLALLLIAGYAAFTGRIRHRLMSRSMEPFRESVEMTRPTLNPNAPENQRYHHGLVLDVSTDLRPSGA